MLFATSTDGEASWTAPRVISTGADRGYYAAPAISPNGTDVWVVYNAFTTPVRNDTTSPATLSGWSTRRRRGRRGRRGLRRGPWSPGGDPRGSSQNNLAAEFLGDYVYAAATRTYGAAVWNDVRRAADWRSTPTARISTTRRWSSAHRWPTRRSRGRGGGRPPAEQDSGAGAGRTGRAAGMPGDVRQLDIFGGSYPDPTP